MSQSTSTFYIYKISFLVKSEVNVFSDVCGTNYWNVHLCVTWTNIKNEKVKNEKNKTTTQNKQITPQKTPQTVIQMNIISHLWKATSFLLYIVHMCLYFGCKVYETEIRDKIRLWEKTLFTALYCHKNICIRAFESPFWNKTFMRKKFIVSVCVLL